MSRFDWTMDRQINLYSVKQLHGYEEDALNTPADSSDPVNGGCGGFSWSALTLKPWISLEYGLMVLVEPMTLPLKVSPVGVLHTRCLYRPMYIIAQNDANNSYNPSL